MLEFVVNDSKRSFLIIFMTNIIIENEAIFKNYSKQQKQIRVFSQYSKNKLETHSSFGKLHIFPTGLEFNKIDKDINLDGKRSHCRTIQSLFLNDNEHQEMKTRINHLKPTAKLSKNKKMFFNADSKGVYQGKILLKM